MIPIRDIYYMLSYAFQVLNEQGYKNIETEQFDNVAELCAAILSKGISVQLKRGLNREYIEETESLFISNTSDAIVNEALQNVEDDLFRMYIISTSKKNKFSDKDELLKAAKVNLQNSKLYKKRAIKNANKIFQEKKIDKKISIEQDVEKEITATTYETNNQIVNKEVRNRVLVAIIKIIKAQGFIVRKENVEECGDYARISSIKPNGEKANFVVYLDGRFAYKFHDYKGLSCEKDIEEFEKKFVDIYGIKLENKNVTWSNPDRLDKMTTRTLV